MFLQDITLVRAKMPSLVRSGDAGIRSQQNARAIARDMLGQVSANPDPPLLPFDDTWIQEIKVRVCFFLLLFLLPVLKRSILFSSFTASFVKAWNCSKHFLLFTALQKTQIVYSGNSVGTLVN